MDNTARHLQATHQQDTARTTVGSWRRLPVTAVVVPKRRHFRHWTKQKCLRFYCSDFPRRSALFCNCLSSYVEEWLRRNSFFLSTLAEVCLSGRDALPLRSVSSFSVIFPQQRFVLNKDRSPACWLASSFAGPGCSTNAEPSKPKGPETYFLSLSLSLPLHFILPIKVGGVGDVVVNEDGPEGRS